MEIREQNGQMKIFYHPEGDIKLFEPISNNELRKFAIDILSYEYANNGVEIDMKSYNTDFSLPNITTKTNGYPKIDFIVVAKLTNENINIDWEIFQSIISKSEKDGSIPRLAIASFWCYRGMGEKAYRGGDFSVKFDFISLMDDNTTLNIENKLTHKELIWLFHKAWKELDHSIIEPYLQKQFHFSSAWIFDELPSRFEYMLYLRGKFETLKKHNIVPKVNIEFIEGKHVLIFDQNGELALFDINCEQGTITSGRLYAYENKTAANNGYTAMATEESSKKTSHNNNLWSKLKRLWN